MTADNECRCLNGEQPSRFSTRWAAGLVCLRRRIPAGCCVALHVLKRIIGDGLSFFVPRLTSGQQVEGGRVFFRVWPSTCCCLSLFVHVAFSDD